MEKNLHYGKLPKQVADNLNKQMPGTLVAGRYRTSVATELSLKHMRVFAEDASPVTVTRCFACSGVDTECPENNRVECLCGRKFFKYYDVTDYTTFVGQSRWTLLWTRLNFKMSSILKKQK